MAGRRVRMRALLTLWRASARRVSSLASRLPGTTRLRFALHGAQRQQRGLYGHGDPGVELKGVVWVVDTKQNASRSDIEDGISTISEQLYPHSLPNYSHGQKDRLSNIVL